MAGNLISMKKISINKSDEVAIIVEKIIEAPDKEVVLSVPRFSHIGESLSNFHLLKREADALEKKIVIESVDDHVVELAEMSGLTAVNPFFAKNKRQFSDIIVTKSVAEKKKKPATRLFRGEELSREERTMDEERDAFKINLEELEKSTPSLDKPSWKLRFPGIFPPKISLPATEFRPKFFIWAFVVFTAGIFVFNILQILPRATVTIIAQTKDWSYKDSVITDKSAVLDIVSMTVPNQVFSQKKNADLKFPASGRRQVEKKASGTVTVYNSYSSDPQPLVEQTRFMTPDGKIFRLAKNITVPGAKVIEGRIVPSSIDTEVVADQPGPDYNVAPVKLFTIPGFKGTPKYQSFYADSKVNMAGGFIGEIAFPTEDDIKSAKNSAQKTLEDSLKVTLFAQIPKEFKVLDGATRYKAVEQKIDEEADQSSSFGVFTEAQLTAIAFKEEDMKSLLTRRAQHDNGEDFDVRSYELSYELPRADFDKGVLTFPVNFKSVLAKHIDIEELRTKLLSKSESDLKSIVLSLPGLDRATISLWPFWVKSVPSNPAKVEIKVE